MRRLGSLALLLTLGLPAAAQQHPRDAEIQDPETRAWWHTTEALSNDSMEGRDTGTAAYQRAAEYVAHRFQAAGLKPAGENGGYFQAVPMHEVDLTPEGTSFTVRRADGSTLPLRFLYEITAAPRAGMVQRAEAPLTFRGYCGGGAMQDVKDKLVICFGTQRSGLPGATDRWHNALSGQARGVVNVDDPYFSLEPPRWPYAYARSVTLKGASPQEANPGDRPTDPTLPVMRLSAEAFSKLLAGTGQDAATILKAGGAQQPLPSFDLDGRLQIRLHTVEKDIQSPNALAVLPGSDPALRDQYLVVAAHLDGYGSGTPVNGDNLYNGTLDDAAYVALLIQMADDLRDGRERALVEKTGIRTGNFDGMMTLTAPKRSILFCAFTGEEKGLLGSRWFVEHPTVPIAAMAADVNLDQLRPLFPLKILTALAIHDTTLGATAMKVGAADGIVVREDREPERGLLRRADHYPFLEAGVPAIGFVFGFEPGTEEERRYRHWYDVQYHRPQDDLTQPVDFHAALQFNLFFYRLVETIADDPERPRMLPGSTFAKK